MFIPPMLAHKAEQPFDDPSYLAEPKMDGFRLILSTVNGVHAYTRHRNEVTDRFPELHRPPVPPGTVLDGELVVAGTDGRPDFEAVMKRLRTQDPAKMRRLVRTLPVQYIVFDIPFYRGRDMSSLPLTERKALLDEALQEDDTFAAIRYTEGNGVALFERCSALGLEGIQAISKT